LGASVVKYASGVFLKKSDRNDPRPIFGLRVVNTYISATDIYEHLFAVKDGCGIRIQPVLITALQLPSIIGIVVGPVMRCSVVDVCAAPRRPVFEHDFVPSRLAARIKVLKIYRGPWLRTEVGWVICKVAALVDSDLNSVICWHKLLLGITSYKLAY
jgi:hypothetical protein